MEIAKLEEIGQALTEGADLAERLMRLLEASVERNVELALILKKVRDELVKGNPTDQVVEAVDLIDSAQFAEPIREHSERVWDAGFDAGRDDIGAAALAVDFGEDENPYRKAKR